MPIVFLLLLFISKNCYSKGFDTIYFDKKWRICEKEMAKFYRVGSVQVKKDKPFYSGEVHDFFINDDKEMDGNYSDEGQKDGQFSFYYPGNVLAATGSFHKEKPHGKWNFYYPSGSFKAELYIYTSHEYVFISYCNEKGDTLLKDGTGKFEWWQYTGAINHPGFSSVEIIFKGEFANGEKHGLWETYKTYPMDDYKPHLLFREQYENGLFKSGIQFSTAFYNKPYYKTANLFYFQVSSQKFASTESFVTNIVFNMVVDQLNRTPV